MAVDQVVASASPGDAVTNAAFALRGLLRGLGPSELFAHHVDPRLAGEVHHLSEYRGGRGDIVVYHASVGEPAVTAFLLERPQDLVLVYHNITPARYFAGIDPGFARLLAAGRAELALLRDRVALALALSAYNAADLAALGYPDVRLSPLVFDPAHLTGTTPDRAMAERLDALDGPLVLFVGQLLPHKRLDLLLGAYHVCCTYLVPEARLAVVGPTRSAPYRSALERMIGELSLEAWITGWVTDAELAALYRRADCFVTMSEHEGVCVPLLEAMAFEVPVVARDLAAVAETTDGAALLLPPGSDVILAGEAIAAVVDDRATARSLAAGGRDRMSRWDPDAHRATFLRHLAEVV
ncbi:MAG: glycosyltransferase [Acidimicrobiia bacterium]